MVPLEVTKLVSKRLLVCLVSLWHLQGIFNFRLFTNYNNKLQALVTTGLGRRNNKTVHIMAIVVMILHVDSLFAESGERVWIVCNNYSMNILLSFILVAFVNHQCIKKLVNKLLVER